MLATEEPTFRLLRMQPASRTHKHPPRGQPARKTAPHERRPLTLSPGVKGHTTELLTDPKQIFERMYTYIIINGQYEWTDEGNMIGIGGIFYRFSCFTDLVSILILKKMRKWKTTLNWIYCDFIEALSVSDTVDTGTSVSCTYAHMFQRLCLYTYIPTTCSQTAPIASCFKQF